MTEEKKTKKTKNPFEGIQPKGPATFPKGKGPKPNKGFGGPAMVRRSGRGG